MQLNIKNNLLILLPQKAIWWEIENTLLISDLHIGKITHFRNAGIALPSHAAEENFTRLDQLMTKYPVKRIIFIGDLFHSDINTEWERFCDWRRQYPEVMMELVLGNHDRLPIKLYQDIDFKIYKEELHVPPFTFAHHPRKTFQENEYVISGHIHPVVRLNGKGRQQLRLPCFHFGAQQAVLPSFGTFTGGFVIDIEPGDKVVAVVESHLISVC